MNYLIVGIRRTFTHSLEKEFILLDYMVRLRRFRPNRIYSNIIIFPGQTRGFPSCIYSVPKAYQSSYCAIVN